MNENAKLTIHKLPFKAAKALAEDFAGGSMMWDNSEDGVLRAYPSDSNFPVEIGPCTGIRAREEAEARAVTRDELLGAMEAAFVSGAIAFAKLNGNPVNMSLAVFAMDAWDSSDKEEYTIMKKFPAPSGEMKGDRG